MTKTCTTAPRKYIIQEMKYLFKYIALLLIAFATVASAQTAFDPIGAGIINQQLSAVVAPENPAPGQEVTITLSAYGTNINAASISWSVNGSRVQSGTGMTQFKLNAGKSGEVKKVVATVTLEGGTTVTKSFTVSSQDVSIIYESDGYTPPFYKGKAAYAREGTVTLVAVPNLMANGTRLSPGVLTYKWSVDGTVQGSKSGYGRSSFEYTGSILGRDVFIEVEVSSASGATKGKSAIFLSPQEPEVLLYERSPLYGTLFNKEIASRGFQLQEKEVTVSAIPYATSAATLSDGTLSYNWSINGSTIPVPKTQSYATLRNATGLQGTSVIGVSVSNTTHLLQMMRNSLNINF